jgi:peptidoglycan LD-endopeptidase LytH
MSRGRSPHIPTAPHTFGPGGWTGGRFTRRVPWIVGVMAVVVLIAVSAPLLVTSRSGDDAVTTTAVLTTIAAPTATAPAAAAEPVLTTPPTTAATAAQATYAFPVRPASDASPSSSHHDYPASDIFAPCGSAVVAPTAGTIQEVTLVDQWSSSNNDPALRGGLSFSLVGADGVRYYGSHLESIEPSVRPGATIRTGDRIGAVGETGNAVGTGCHLHFGISTPCGPGDVLRRRGEIWPQTYLTAWREGEPRSPRPEIDPGSC